MIKSLKFIFDNIQLHIYLIWIKGQKGLITNERADNLAKKLLENSIHYYNLVERAKFL